MILIWMVKENGCFKLDHRWRSCRTDCREDHGKGHGFIGNIIIGIIGANIGGFVASRFGLGQVDGINLTSILIAAGGAVILLALLRLIRGKQ